MRLPRNESEQIFASAVENLEKLPCVAVAEAVQCLPLLYGVLTKTVYTAQAHFAARHA